MCYNMMHLFLPVLIQSINTVCTIFHPNFIRVNWKEIIAKFILVLENEQYKKIQYNRHKRQTNLIIYIALAYYVQATKDSLCSFNQIKAS